MDDGCGTVATLLEPTPYCANHIDRFSSLESSTAWVTVDIQAQRSRASMGTGPMIADSCGTVATLLEPTPYCANHIDRLSSFPQQKQMTYRQRQNARKGRKKRACRGAAVALAIQDAAQITPDAAPVTKVTPDAAQMIPDAAQVTPVLILVLMQLE